MGLKIKNTVRKTRRTFMLPDEGKHCPEGAYGGEIVFDCVKNTKNEHARFRYVEVA